MERSTSDVNGEVSDPTSKIVEEKPGAASGKIRFRSHGWRIISKLKRLGRSPAVHKTVQPTKRISFKLDCPYISHQELQTLIPNVQEQALFTLIQDLNVVLSAHVSRSSYLLRKIESSGQHHCLHQGQSIQQICPFNLDKTIEDFVCTITQFKTHPQEQSCDLELGASHHQATTVNSDHLLLWSDEEIDCKGMEKSRGEETYSNTLSAHLEIPTGEQHSKVPWPAIVGTGDFKSNLCKLAASLDPPMWKHHLEAADFCIAPRQIPSTNQCLYNDGWILATLGREDFQSFEPNQIISPPILAAWGRILNSIWTHNKHPHSCLHIINQDDPSGSTQKLMEMWHYWMLSGDVDYTSPALIFIPVKIANHYDVVVINFRDKKIQHYCGVGADTHAAGGEVLARDVGSYFSLFLMQIGDNRSVHVESFCFESLSTNACAGYSPAESGVLVMTLMEFFSGVKKELLGLIMDKTAVILRRRVLLCTKIASSNLNRLQARFVESVAFNIHKKVEDNKYKAV